MHRASPKSSTHAPQGVPKAAEYITFSPEMREAIEELRARLNIPAEDVDDMLDAVTRGEDVAEHFGYTPQICNAIERAALAYYRSGHYEKAGQIFAWLADMTGGKRGTAWRGLGACHQASRQFDMAIALYQRAIACDSDDILARVYCGECLCQCGRSTEGVALLQQVLEAHGDADVSARPHIVRARAIIASQVAAAPGPSTSSGKAPSATIPDPAAAAATATASVARRRHVDAALAARQQKKNRAPTPHAKASFSADTAQRRADAHDAGAAGAHKADGGGTGDDKEGDASGGIDTAMAKESLAHTYDSTMQRVMADPALRAQLDTIAQAVRQRTLTLREVAEFSEEQMDAGYAVACQYLQQGNPTKALETAGWLLWLDARDARFYQLAGICMHHLKLWCLADYLYGEATLFSEPDPTTLVYHGEVKIMLDERPEAKKLLEQGVALASRGASTHDIAKRGQFLLKSLRT